MERTFRTRKEILSLAKQNEEKINARKDGIKIGSKLFDCTCCICGNHFIRHRKASYFCDNDYCRKVKKSLSDYKYRQGEKGQETRRRNRKTPTAIETRKRYEQTENFRKIKSERAKYYRQSDKVWSLDKVRKLKFYYRKFSALRNKTIDGADFISFEDWKELYSANNCYYCGKKIEGRDKTVDHKTPISKGGTNARDNLVMCCQSCNSKKNNKTEKEFLALIARSNTEKKQIWER